MGSLTVECTGDSGVESSVVIIDSMSGVEEQEVPREPSVSDRVERAPSHVGSDLGGSSGESSAHECTRMFQGMMAGLMRASDSRGSDTLLDKGRMVDSIPNYKDGTEISKFIRGMEADLRD